MKRLILLAPISIAVVAVAIYSRPAKADGGLPPCSSLIGTPCTPPATTQCFGESAGADWLVCSGEQGSATWQPVE